LVDPPARDIVLVVDDSPGTLQMLTDALDETGFTVLVAPDGTSAVSLVEKATPDIVLMDAVMPGMDGFDTCRAMKRRPELTGLPVIFMTGLRETDDIVRGLEAGGVDYVTKPVSPPEIIARIRVHLANARLTRSTQQALDVAGRYLLAADRAGRVLWGTPQAMRVLTADATEADGMLLPPRVRDWLAQRGGGTGPDAITLPSANGAASLEFVHVGRIGGHEILLRLIKREPGGDEAQLRRKLGVTAREAEVLMWLGRGKQSRDIADILGLSPRTVMKHLEQIYAKLGVENRASAAALTIRALGEDIR
jgi:DNA-binding response OmpR family regulator/DNA-binding CsgD family transcriptional regulator